MTWVAWQNSLLNKVLSQLSWTRPPPIKSWSLGSFRSKFNNVYIHLHYPYHPLFSPRKCPLQEVLFVCRLESWKQKGCFFHSWWRSNIHEMIQHQNSDRKSPSTQHTWYYKSVLLQYWITVWFYMLPGTGFAVCITFFISRRKIKRQGIPWNLV